LSFLNNGGFIRSSTISRLAGGTSQWQGEVLLNDSSFGIISGLMLCFIVDMAYVPCRLDDNGARELRNASIVEQLGAVAHDRLADMESNVSSLVDVQKQQFTALTSAVESFLSRKDGDLAAMKVGLVDPAWSFKYTPSCSAQSATRN
jgi:hypothetical protein